MEDRIFGKKINLSKLRLPISGGRCIDEIVNAYKVANNL